MASIIFLLFGKGLLKKQMGIVLEMIEFSILITTKSRLGDSKVTLGKIRQLIDNQAVECIICDDGSSDGTFDFVKKNYPQIELLKNEVSKGLITSRNLLLNGIRAKYNVLLDDEAFKDTPAPLKSNFLYLLKMQYFRAIKKLKKL